MSNTETLSARDRIGALVDENSFVEIGAGITKRSTDFNLQEKSVPWGEPLVRCMRRRLPMYTNWP